MAADAISFARGAPSADILPADAVREAAARALESDWKRALSYGTGIGPSRALRVDRSELHGGIDAEQVMVTNGSMEAAALLFRYMLEPGDRVIVEQPTYDRTLLLLSRAGVDFVPMPLEEDGLDVDAFEAALAAGPVKLAHVIPNFHNPAGCTLSAEKRERLVELAAEHGFWLFEDDPYRLISFGARGACRRCSRCDEAGRVIHASSFSKTVSPGVRVGYLAGPADEITDARQARRRALHLAEHARRVDRPRALPLGDRSSENIEFVNGALRERRDALVDGAPRADPRGRVRRARRRLLPLARPRRATSTRAELLDAAKDEGVGLRRRPRLHARRRQLDSLRLSFASVPPEQIGEGVGAHRPRARAQSAPRPGRLGRGRPARRRPPWRSTGRRITGSGGMGASLPLQAARCHS